MNSSRGEKENKGRRWALEVQHLLRENLRGQPIRRWATLLSSQLACKSFPTRQATCLSPMNKRVHQEAKRLNGVKHRQVSAGPVTLDSRKTCRGQ